MEKGLVPGKNYSILTLAECGVSHKFNDDITITNYSVEYRKIGVEIVKHIKNILNNKINIKHNSIHYFPFNFHKGNTVIF